uniref:Major capsid protein n=1 Tax=Dulem virus 212 TaxID=3145689 RepID=A0AAU8B5X1_9VIRU
MGKQPFISHVVNGYSRYDVPESKAFSCTPGILYPARIDFINARDRVTISQGVDFRSNPLSVPTFNPYTVRLHRFWVPLQLYHPEMRTNSSKFDMNNLSTNWIRTFVNGATVSGNPLIADASTPYSNSLLSWLRVATTPHKTTGTPGSVLTAYNGVSLPPSSTSGYYTGAWANADTYLAYWDIVRNYYGYSQWGLFSFAWPTAWVLRKSTGTFQYTLDVVSNPRYFYQVYGNVLYLDAYYESQFYPSSVESSNNTYNRSNLFLQIVKSDMAGHDTTAGGYGDGYPVAPISDMALLTEKHPVSQLSGELVSGEDSLWDYFTSAHPMAVVPSSPDRFSRLLPNGSSSAVSMTGVTTIPQLAVASRLQEYKDLLGAGGSRFSDWLETFFASKIEHVDRPKLLFSASQTINAQVVMNQTGDNGTNSTLGAQGGSIAFNSLLGREQSYYFREPGYMIDMLSIRPVYYWAGIRPDYLDYQGSDYFNPIYNDIGYQSVSEGRMGVGEISTTGVSQAISVASEPCFNEFRSSYDEVLGALSIFSSGATPLQSYWVQQRSNPGARYGVNAGNFYYPMLFTDISMVNSPFASNVEDNFFVNLSYNVRKKNLVNKTFATRLSNR